VFIFIFYLMQSILCYVVLPNVEIYLEEAQAISLQKHNSQFLRHFNMVALWNRADHYMFLRCGFFFFYLLLFPRLISAVAD